MVITTVVSRLLQSIEFFRSGVGKYLTIIIRHCIQYKIFLLPGLIFIIVRTFMSLFAELCTRVGTLFNEMNFHGVTVGGVNILALANSVLPIDELIGLIVAWFGVYSTCATIRFIRAAWAAIPLKAT